VPSKDPKASDAMRPAVFGGGGTLDFPEMGPMGAMNLNDNTRAAAEPGRPPVPSFHDAPNRADAAEQPYDGETGLSIPWIPVPGFGLPADRVKAILFLMLGGLGVGLLAGSAKLYSSKES
jgi:hypothetical protein